MAEGRNIWLGYRPVNRASLAWRQQIKNRLTHRTDPWSILLIFPSGGEPMKLAHLGLPIMSVPLVKASEGIQHRQERGLALGTSTSRMARFKVEVRFDVITRGAAASRYLRSEPSRYFEKSTTLGCGCSPQFWGRPRISRTPIVSCPQTLRKSRGEASRPASLESR